MSQSGILNISGGGGSGSPIETVTGNDNIAVPPTANNIFLVGGTSTAFNPNGIATSGNAGTSTETISLTNRIQGSQTTSDGSGQTQIVYTFPLGATPGVFQFSTQIVAFDKTSILGAGYWITNTVRTTGAAGVLVGTPDIILQEEGELSNVNVFLAIVGNSLELEVTGLAGKTIDWFAITTYVFVS